MKVLLAKSLVTEAVNASVLKFLVDNKVTIAKDEATGEYSAVKTGTPAAAAPKAYVALRSAAGFDVSRPNEDGGAPFDRHRGTQIHAFSRSAPIISRRCSRDHTAVQAAALQSVVDVRCQGGASVQCGREQTFAWDDGEILCGRCAVRNLSNVDNWPR